MHWPRAFLQSRFKLCLILFLPVNRAKKSKMIGALPEIGIPIIIICQRQHTFKQGRAGMFA